MKSIESEFGQLIRRIAQKNNLTSNETKKIMINLLNNKYGKGNDVCFGAFLSALQVKKPTIEEVTGLIKAILENDRINVNCNIKNLCGIVGSGKDDIKTFNISTASAIVAATAGVKVVKNGSRSESSVAGTTDVLEAFGLNVKCDSKLMILSLKNNNIGFFDAEPYFPKMMKNYVGKFYFIHPLSYILSIASGLSFNKILFGLADPNTEFTASILKKLNFDRSMVVCGFNNQGNKYIDELSNIGKTKISELKNGSIKTYFVKPEDFNLKRAKEIEISQGKNINENMKIIENVFSNKGPYLEARRDILSLNAGALIYLSGLANDLKEGITIAKNTLLSGKCIKTLNKLVRYSNGIY